MKNSIEKTELVREGIFNGAKISSKLLKDWVKDFEQNAKDGYFPTVHIGHTLGEDDTKPAEGFITKMWLEGKRLYASIAGIGEDFVERVRRYPYRSIEATKDRLRSLALLGATPPAVKTAPVLLSESSKDGIFIIKFFDMNDEKDKVELENEELPTPENESETEESVETHAESEVTEESTDVEETAPEGEEVTEEETVEESEGETPGEEVTEVSEVELKEESEAEMQLSEIEVENIKLKEELGIFKKEKLEREVSDKVANFVFSDSNNKGFLKSGDTLKKIALELSDEHREKLFNFFDNLEVIDRTIVSKPKGFGNDKSLEEGEKDKIKFSELARIKSEHGLNTDQAIELLAKERPELF